MTVLDYERIELKSKNKNKTKIEIIKEEIKEFAKKIKKEPNNKGHLLTTILVLEKRIEELKKENNNVI